MGEIAGSILRLHKFMGGMHTPIMMVDDKLYK